MKKSLVLLLFLITLAHSWTKADDIKGFEIEGMSVGDSLLDYFSEEEIIKAIRKNQYTGKDGKFIEIQFNKKTSTFLKTYEGLQIIYKKNDKDYIIYSLAGGIFFGKDINSCLEKQKEVEKDLSILLENKERKAIKKKWDWDETGQSYIHFVVYYFDTKDQIEISCFEFGENMNSEHYLAVSVDKKEFIDWLD